MARLGRIPKKIQRGRPQWLTGPAYVFLVLSDVHHNATNASKTWFSRFFRSFAEAWRRIQDDVPGLQFDGMLLLGDLTQASRRSEYEAVGRDLLKPIADALRLPSSKILAVPGNHDHLRNVIVYSSANASTDGLPEGAVPARHPQSLLHIKARTELCENDRERWEECVGSRFFLFHQWAAEHTAVVSRTRTAGPWSTVFGEKPFPLTIVGLNSAIAAAGFREKENLWIGEPQVQQVLGEEVPHRLGERNHLVMALMHHSPTTDMDPKDADARALLFSKAHLVLHGHHHKEAEANATDEQPVVLSLGAAGHPGSNPEQPDVCAILRLEQDRVQVFRLKHQMASDGNESRFEWKTKDGRIVPDVETAILPDRSTYEVAHGREKSR